MVTIVRVTAVLVITMEVIAQLAFSQDVGESLQQDNMDMVRPTEQVGVHVDESVEQDDVDTKLMLSQVEKHHLTGCHLVIITRQHSQLFSKMIRHMSVGVEAGVVVEAESVLSQDQQAQYHHLEGLWGETRTTCQALILDSTSDTNNTYSVLRLVETKETWFRSRTRVFVVVDGTTRVEDVLLHHGTVHDLYLALHTPSHHGNSALRKILQQEEGSTPANTSRSSLTVVPATSPQTSAPRLRTLLEVETPGALQLQSPGGSSCRGAGLPWDLVSATLAVTKALPTIDLLIIFHGYPDSCLLEGLWGGGVSGRVLTGAQWWRGFLHHTSYHDHASLYLLVGTLHWITDILSKVRELYRNDRINAMRTRWIWLVDPRTESTSLRHSWSLSSPSAVCSFGTLEEVSEVLEEGMRGVLVYETCGNITSLPGRQRQPNVGERFVSRRWVNVGSVADPGDGSWLLKLAATWTSHGLRVNQPLWPPPSFNLRGRIIRIGGVQKPQVFESETKDVRLEEVTGYAAHITKIIQGRLNFTTNLSFIKGFGVRAPNGSFNGLVGLLQRKEADVCPLDFSPSLERAQVVDFGAPLGEDTVNFVSKAPTILTPPFLLLQIFTPVVWAVLLCFGLVVAILTNGAARLEDQVGTTSDSNSPVTYFYCVLRICVWQNSPRLPRGSGARLLAGSAMFVALLCGSVYSGLITAFLAIPVKSVPIDSVDDVLASNVKVAFRNRTITYVLLVAREKSEGGVLSEAKSRAIQVESAKLSTWQFFSSVADGSTVYVDGSSSFLARTGKFEERGQDCKFHIGQQPIKVDLDVFAFAQNSPIMYQFDDTITKMKYFGLIEQIKKGYYSYDCHRGRRSSDGPTRMSIKQLQGAFFVLAIGEVMAMIVMVGEVAKKALTIT